MKKLLLFSTIVAFVCFNTSCNKLSIEPDQQNILSQNQKIMLEKFQPFTKKDGEIDLTTVKYSDLEDKNLYLLTAFVKGSNHKKYVLSVDKRSISKTIFSRFIFESNIPTTLDDQNESSFNGFVQITSLEADHFLLKVNFKNGIKKIVESGNSSSTFRANENDTSAVSPLTDCIKSALRRMSFGDWVVFIATEPESMAALILACAIDVIFLT